MPKGNGFTIRGVDDVNRILGQIAPKHAKNLARSTVHAIAADIAKEAKKKAPKNSGVLKKAIKAVRRKSPPFAPRSDVIVQMGPSAKNDAWYWKFIEFGTLKQSQRPFLLPVYNIFKADIERIYAENFVAKLLKKLEKAKK